MKYLYTIRTIFPKTYLYVVKSIKHFCCPTGFFAISEPRGQGIGEFHVVQGRRTTDFEAPKL